MMRILYVTTIGKTMSFFQSFIKKLIDEGHHVSIATNEHGSPVPEFYHELGCDIFQTNFSRSPLSFDNINAYRQLRSIVETGTYDIVHCHTPNASVITRLVCRKLRKKTGLKVFYTAHGFHFYKGAPKRNWLFFYPIEKLCAHFTDKLITINKEDYGLAKKKLHAAEVCYVPGVGVDLSRFSNTRVDLVAKRQEIGVPENAFLVISVGELNNNKNHQTVIRALGLLNNPNVHYAIAGKGEKLEALSQLARDLNIVNQVHFLGYRTDIPELNHVADAFCLPSHREGLGLAAIEAMACGLPLITSNMHGINDYSTDGVTGYKCDPTSTEGFANAIKNLIENLLLREKMKKTNKMIAKRYDAQSINLMLSKIYGI